MDIGKIIWWIVRLYVPPRENDPEYARHVVRYHAAQSVGILGIWVLAWLVALWLFGRLSPPLPQVAWANDVGVVKADLTQVKSDVKKEDRKLTDIKLLLLENNIHEAVKAVCLAQRAGNQTDLDNANAQLSELGESYYDITGRAFAQPSCSTILVEATK